ncbi:dihydrodipicolinate synthase family protein [Ammoniphilus resinae]|uniref:Dihydrodipicolinate synthase family protein n=1 Tax=Ammoniphilus resinae TaxID=861532 RepID=A0ABS4GU79_9BACL|nr:dihydrodipicolinate synthase family protein [Ammoniphilus resinae]MBP1933818.1 hypothetical protein [Ammoniphilus resinae]
MHHKIVLPTSGGNLQTYSLIGIPINAETVDGFRSRSVYAAAHVVCNPLADTNPTEAAEMDWDATLSYRRYLWSLGLSVAEAMDTAQRGMGLKWEATQELIQRSLTEAKAVGGGIACGAGTDQLPTNVHVTLETVEKAYIEQCEFIEKYDGEIILMASRALTACARSADDYYQIYGKILSQVQKPVILHWLGEMFDPALAGYWGHRDLQEARKVVLEIIASHPEKVKGIKVSLLDQDFEITMRRMLPKGVRMYTGDDFNYPTLIRGDGQGYSDALLGIFDPIAPAASAAIRALDRGELDEYERLLAPTLPLSRHIFKAPTYFYKTGVVFMAYLNGHQSHFRMVGGLENARSIVHLSELFMLADQAGLLRDPETAVHRMKTFLSVAGISQ